VISLKGPDYRSDGCWRRGCRAWHRILQGTGGVCALMLSEKSKRGNDKDKRSNVGYRCERIHSSVEAAVMAVERRDSVIYNSNVRQPEIGGFNGGRKVV